MTNPWGRGQRLQRQLNVRVSQLWQLWNDPDVSSLNIRRIHPPPSPQLPLLQVCVLTYGLRMAQEIPGLFNLLSVGLPVLLLMGF